MLASAQVVCAHIQVQGIPTRPPQFAQSARLSWRHICRNMRRKTVQMMQFLNKMDIPILEYLFGTGKFIQILIDSTNHDFDEQTLEAQ